MIDEMILYAWFDQNVDMIDEMILYAWFDQNGILNSMFNGFDNVSTGGHSQSS